VLQSNWKATGLSINQQELLMSFDSLESADKARTPRRIFLRNTGFTMAAFSAAAFASSTAAAAATSRSGSPVEQDVAIMQGALALEHEGIAAYRLAGASGLLTPDTKKVALIFLGHHQQHRDSLATLISKAGGEPVQPKSDAQYTQQLNLGSLKSEGDVVVLATHLERGAANAYALQVGALQDRQLVHLFTQLSADEAVHWTTLNNAAGAPIPTAAYLFG
jgi:rubrerythrin